jgi:hypothetical protein
MEYKGLNTGMRYFEITNEVLESVNSTSDNLNRIQKGLKKKSEELLKYESKLRSIQDSRNIAVRSGIPSQRAERVAKATAKRADATRIYADAIRSANSSMRPKPPGALP